MSCCTICRWPYVTVGLKSAIWTPDVAVNLWTHGQGNENEIKNLHWAAPRPVCVSLSLCMSYQQNRNLSCCFFRLILDCQRKEKKTLFPFLNIENKKNRERGLRSWVRVSFLFSIFFQLWPAHKDPSAALHFSFRNDFHHLRPWPFELKHFFYFS